MGALQPTARPQVGCSGRLQLQLELALWRLPVCMQGRQQLGEGGQRVLGVQAHVMLQLLNVGGSLKNILHLSFVSTHASQKGILGSKQPGRRSVGGHGSQPGLKGRLANKKVESAQDCGALPQEAGRSSVIVGTMPGTIHTMPQTQLMPMLPPGVRQEV